MVEAYVNSTTRFGTAFAKTPSLLTLDKFSQNPAMKHHLLSSGTKNMAEGSPFGPRWGVGLRADDPEARNPRWWPGKKLLGKALPSVTSYLVSRSSSSSSINSSSIQ